MKEAYIVIDGVKKEVTFEQLEKLGIVGGKRWRAKLNSSYFSVSADGQILELTELKHKHDDYRYYSHNYFRTLEEANKYASVLDTEMNLLKFADTFNDEFKVYKYYLGYDINMDLVTVCTGFINTSFGRVAFSSQEIAKNAIKQFDKELLKQYVTWEW